MRTILTASLIIGLTACSAPGANIENGSEANAASAKRSPTSPEISASQVAQGNRGFAINLYRELAKEDDGNLFISPISIASAFGPVTAGSAGATRDGIAQALGYPASGDNLHAAIAQLNAGLQRDGDGTKLTIANAMWVKQSFEIRPEMLATTRDIYGARIDELDFGGDPAGSADTINGWVRAQTNNRIPSIIAARNLDEMTRLVVTNAVYFLGDWAQPFNAASTRPGPFIVSAGQQLSLPMMSQRNGYRIFEGDGFSVIDLPYKDPRMSMSILLPDKSSTIGALERAITPDMLNATLAALDEAQTGDVQLMMPKFQLETKYTLNKSLAALGMADAFDSQRADFSLINASEDLFIHQVLHKTFLRVDEKGTEAAAATSIEVGIESMPRQFRIDRPFIIMVRDHETGAVLFYGRIVKPLISE